MEIPRIGIKSEQYLPAYTTAHSNARSLLKLSTEKKVLDLENTLMVAKEDGEGVGWIGILGLIDADYCLWN